MDDLTTRRARPASPAPGPAERLASPTRPIGSVTRAVALLDVLAAHGPLGVSALAREIGVNASTASRLLATLHTAGLVERTEGGPYRLGMRLVELSEQVLDRMDVRAVARPVLASLVRETGETATLSVPGDGDGDAVTVDFLLSPASVTSVARVGRSSIGHATATGKVVLAFTGDGTVPDGPLERITEHTIVDPIRLAAELSAVRGRGWAEASGERERDLAAVAAPIFGRDGQVVAILGLQGPRGRLDATRRRRLSRPLRQAAATLGGRLPGGAERGQLQG